MGGRLATLLFLILIHLNGWAQSEITIDGLKYEKINGKEAVVCKGFANSSFTKVSIPSVVKVGDEELTVLSIGERAFANCSSLTEVEFPWDGQLEDIQSYAFYNSGISEEIMIPASVKTIGESAFGNCKSLGYVSFGSYSDISGYSDAMFTGSTISGEIWIPAGSYLKYCEQLPSVKDKIENAGEFLTVGDLKFRLYKEDKSAEIYEPADGAHPEGVIFPLTVSDGSTVYDVTTIGAESFYLTDKPLTYLKSITFPAGSKISYIAEAAFCDCTNLSSVNFLGSCDLESISKDAFYNTAITNIIIPKTVRFIGNNAFGNCLKLETVTFEYTGDFTYYGDDGYKFYPTYDANMLADCKNLKTIYVPKGMIEAYKSILHVDASVKFVEGKGSSTSVDSVTNVPSYNLNKVYTLDGKQVKNFVKQGGIYIKNGKKFVVNK